MKIFLVGGGSGGHIIPTLAAAAALKSKRPDTEFLYAGSARAQDRQLVEAEGINFVAISAGKLRRYFDLQNAADVFKVGIGVIEAWQQLRRFQPQVVFAKGGFVSVPVAVAARQLGIPLVLHESDSRIGLANRLLLGYASKIAVTFPVETYAADLKPADYAKLVYTGLPLRVKSASEIKTFSRPRPTLLVIGGSQGAASLNRAIWAALPTWLTAYNVIHQVGEGAIDEAAVIQSTLPIEMREAYRPFGFDPKLQDYARAATVVITRAGSSIFELAALARPTIMVPLAGSANDHQVSNARYFEQKGAAEIIYPDQELTAGLLTVKLDLLMKDEAHRAAVAASMNEIGNYHKQAADRVADLILEIAE